MARNDRVPSRITSNHSSRNAIIMSSAPTSLCPGYRLVEEFDHNEEYESGEEISYVTFDLGNIEPTLVPSSSTYRLIVRLLDSDHRQSLTAITGARYSYSLSSTIWDHS